MYQTVSQLVSLAEKQNMALWDVVLMNETALTGKSKKEIFEQLEAQYEVMCSSSEKALRQVLPTTGGMISGVAFHQFAYAGDSGGLCGGFINTVMARALSGSETNASMGRICAAPTAGACGIMPAVLISVAEKYQLEKSIILKGLLTASGIGTIMVQNATVSGAEGGCQAECGVAAAMTAAAAVQMRGGTNEMAANACAFALINCMGLVCDPVAGLVQVPCAFRNASQAVNALLSADLAMSGITSVIPVDEVIEAMYQVGKMMPMQLKETALGGIAATPSGQIITKNIFG